MADKDDPIESLAERVSQLGERLDSLADKLGYSGQRPDDPAKASRWDMPLYWHVSDVRDSLHGLRNYTQVLSGLIEQLSEKIDRSASVSRENQGAIARLTEIVRNLEALARQIEESIRRVAREKPMLMRDIWWLDTEPIEIGLFICTAGETIFFLVGSETLVRSAMFQAISPICPIPAVWAILCGVMSLGAGLAFVSRRRVFRSAAAFAHIVYFGVTGTLPMFFTPGALGSLHHGLFCLSAMWVLSRRPSNAT